MRRALPGGLALVVALVVACSRGGDEPAPAAGGGLVLVVAVDQLLPDALDQGRPGGLGRLARDGRVYERAFLGHASTDTCSGHASMLSGRHPGPAGIAGNTFIDSENGQEIYCVDDPSPESQVFGADHGRSSRFFEASTLGDWMQEVEPETRVYSLSGKDRAAIMLAGQQPTGVFWLLVDEEGGFTTSRRYASALPSWLLAFNGTDRLRDGFLARVPETWAHPKVGGMRDDDYPAESDRLSRTSPHPIRGAEVKGSLDRVYRTPFVDQAVLELARLLLEVEELGRGPATDLLALSLSGTDNVGHLWGPESQEMHANLERLDLGLGRFLEELEASLGGAPLWIVLTSDHGVLPLPEWLAETDRNLCPSTQPRIDARGLLVGLDLALDARFGATEGTWFDRAGYRFTLDRALLAERGVEPEALVAAAREFLEQHPAIARVWTAAEIAAGDGPEPLAPVYRASYNPRYGGDFVIEPERGCLITAWPTGTTHGSPHDYDRHVPLVFAGPGVKPGRVLDPVLTVDIGPTLARHLELPVPDGLDGRAQALDAPPSAMARP